ncbi:hypothetical protein BDZ45DRAFT_257126 [Acephala macrosclerotiorum]|nr:hypothetical protein BDZ45DRAFT_257126 [Acephala macrosclerotiorum]
MIGSIKDLLARARSISKPPPPCPQPYCTNFDHCLKAHGEETLSLTTSYSPLNTLFEEYFHMSNNGQSIFAWDSDDGWHQICHFCQHERCPDCQGQIFTSVTDFHDVLTFENREVWICIDCVHGLCPGWRLRLVSSCRVCRHEACAECLGRGDERSGLVSCECYEATMAEERRNEVQERDVPAEEGMFVGSVDY